MNLFSVFLFSFVLCVAPSLVAADDQPQPDRQAPLVTIDASGHFVYNSAKPAIAPASVREARLLARQVIDEEKAKRKSRKPAKLDPLKPEPVRIADDPLPCNQGTYPCDIPIICMPAPPPYPYGAGTGCGGSCLSAANRIFHRVLHLFG